MNQTQQQSDLQQLEPIKWQAAIPLLSTSLILKQLSVVFLIPTACLLVFLLGLAWIEGQLTLTLAGNYILVLTLILFGLLLLSMIGMAIVYGNQYQVEYVVNLTGITSSTVGKTKRKNAIINTLLALSGKPGFAGAGVLAASRQSELVKWKSVTDYKANLEKSTIQLNRGKHTLMLVQCTTENYSAVLQWVRQSITAQTH